MNKAGCVLRRIIGNVIVIMMLAVSAILLIPRAFHMKPMQVLTGSMEPNYPRDSLIYVKPVAFEHIQTGDVITFYKGENTVVTHRVIEIDEQTKTFQTKGDANEETDSGVIPYDRVIGRVCWYIPKVGRILSLLPDMVHVTQTHAQFYDITTMRVNRFRWSAVNIAVVLDTQEEQQEERYYEQKGNSIENVYTRYGGYENTSHVQMHLQKGVSAQCTVRILNRDLPVYPTQNTYVRVRLLPMLVYDNTQENEANNCAGTIAAADIDKYVTFTYTQDTYWKQKEVQVGERTQEYMYYTKPLAPGAQTENLLESVTCTSEIPEGMHLELGIFAEGIAASESIP